MVSSALQKLLRNQSQASKIFTYFRSPRLPLPPPVLPRIYSPIDTLPFQNHPKTDCLAPNHCFSGALYPSFSFGHFLNPISPPTTLIGFEPDEEKTPDDSRIIRADSVKKKRKKKMNKHKLRKLRKRLRRKT